MPRIIVVGDTADHGGTVIEGSPNTVAGPQGGEQPCARVGDILNCALHGPQPIVTGSPTVEINGRAAACEGDTAACGAVLIATISESTFD